MRIGVPRETADGERRVALVPEAVRKLSSVESTAVLVERGAGVGAVIPDEAFADAGAQLVDAAAALGADVVLKVAPPSEEEIGALGSETSYLGFLAPLTNGEGVSALARAGVTSF